MTTVTAPPSKPQVLTQGEAQSPGWWPLVVIASAHLMAILDTTVMFVALPSAQHALGLTTTSRQWVVTAYTLAFASLLLLGGRLADRLGARRTLLIGVIGFACASAVGGASIDGAMLIAARAVQGGFAAILVSSTKSLLITVYTGENDRARAIGVFTATLTAGLAVGLILGGVLTTELSWRWCLYVNLILSLVTIIGAPRVLPAPIGRKDVKIDFTSVLLASVGMLSLIYGLGEVPSVGWHSTAVIGSLAAAAASLAAFGARQVGRPHPLLPIRVVRDCNRAGGLVAMVFNSLSTFGMMLILTYQLQTVMHYTPVDTGLALVPFAAAAALGSAVIAPKLVKRISPRTMVTAGILLSAAGLCPLIGLTSGSHYAPLILIAEIIEGFGTGIAGPAILQTALRGVLPGDTGAASAASSAAGQLGSSIGAALLNTIPATSTVGYLAASKGAGVPAATVHGFTVAMAWGAGILVVSVVPILVLINAKAPLKRK